MGDVVTGVAWIAGAWVTLWALRFFLALQEVLKIELGDATFTPTPVDDVPEAWRTFLLERLPELERLGLAPRTFLRFNAMADAPGAPARWALALTTAEGDVAAMLTQTDLGDPLEPHALHLEATFEDGTKLASTNGASWAILGDVPGVERVDVWAPTFEGQWRGFCERFEARARETRPVAFDDEGRLREAARSIERLREAWLGSGVVRRNEAGLTPTFRNAVKVALRALRAQPKLRALHQARRAEDVAHGSRSAGLPEVLEAEVYLRLEAARLREPRGKQWLSVLGVTALIFGVSVLGWLEPQQVLVIGAVLLVHELGHWAAMRAFGYRDARIFFIPFFGAAAAGSKKNVSLTEELVVLFAGPVPGIVLAIALDLAFPSLRGDHVFDFALFTLVGLNALNLMPVYPLDGGKIVDALVFAQRPILVVVFRVGAAIALFTGAFLATDLVLAIVGLLVALNVPLASRAARLDRAVQEARAATSIDPLLLVVRTARTLGFASLPMGSRFVMFRQVRERFERGRASVWKTASWLAVYSSSLVGCVVAVAWIGAGAMVAPAEPKMYEASRFSDALRCDDARLVLAEQLAALDPGRGEQLMAMFVCEAASRDDVTRIVEALAPLKLASRTAPIRPPWTAPATADEARINARARDTFVAYERARNLAMGELFPPPTRLERLEGFAFERPTRDYGASHRALQARLEQWVDDASRAGDLDVPLAGELVASSGRPRFDLVERLGVLPTIADARGVRVHPDHEAEACTMVQAFEQGDEVLVVAHAERTAPLEAAARWLCASGCTALRVATEVPTAWLDEPSEDEPQ